ncbi:MAG: hypothetical protein ACT4QG_05430 [Sporichthyaceae bacterium]
MTQRQLRVVVAEDNFLVREGTRRLLEAPARSRCAPRWGRRRN